MARHVYHWKHGWIPLDHEAALKKAKGNHAAASAMLQAAEHSRGIQSRRDVAHAVRDLPNVPPADRPEPKRQIVEAAHRHNATDLVPESVKRSTPSAQRATSARGARGTTINVGDDVSYANDAKSKLRAVEINPTTGKVRLQNAFQSGAQGTWVHPAQLVPYGQGRGEPPRAVGLTNPDTGHARGAPRGRSAGTRSSPALHPDLVRDLRGGSAEAHLVTDASGTRFSPERTKLHDEIVRKVVAGHKAQENPAFVMLGGGPASGKTKAAEAAASDFPDAIKIDPDELKKMLPEYAQLSPEKAASFVHEESSYLAKRVTEEALKTRANVVLDAVGDSSSASVLKKVRMAREAGYSVHGRYVTVPTDIAQQRAHARGVKSGRVVPAHVIADSHAGVSRVFPDVLHEFDTAALYDNTTEWKQVLTKYRGQPEIIHDLELWRAFLQKGKKP